MSDPARAEAVASLARAGRVGGGIRGECMTPVLRAGDRIEIEPRRLILPGDVVAFVGHDGLPRAHRVLGYARSRGAWCLVTRGDRAGAADPPTPLAHVLGVVSDAQGSRARAGLAYARWVAREVVRVLR